jgi:hypothetical protein
MTEQFEKSLFEESEILNLFRFISDCVWVAFPEGPLFSYLYLSPSMKSLLGTSTAKSADQWLSVIHAEDAPYVENGYKAAEVVGRSVSILFPQEQRNELGDILNAVRRGEKVELPETTRIRKDGQKIWVSLSVTPLRASSGEVPAKNPHFRCALGRRMDRCCTR